MPLKHITTFQLFGLKVIDIYWRAARSEIFNIYQARMKKNCCFGCRRNHCYVLPRQSIHIFVSKLPSLVCKIDFKSNRSLSVKFCFWQKLTEKYITNKWWHSNMFMKIYWFGSFCRRKKKLGHNRVTVHSFLNLVEFFCG